MHEICDILRKTPNIYYSDDLKFFRETIDYVQNYESEDEEEDLPPDSVFSSTKTNQEILIDAKINLQNDELDECIKKCGEVLTKNPDNAKAYRLRSQAFYNKSMYDKAYFDMCESQKLDYDDEYNMLHCEMKGKYEYCDPTHQNDECSERKTDGELPFKNIDLNNVMNDPKIMQLVNQVMADPNMMNNLKNMTANMI